MRKLLAVGGAAALALWAMAASADEVTGTISNIDLNRNTFQLEGKTFTASPSQHRGRQAVRVEGRRQSEGRTRGRPRPRKSRTTPYRSKRSSSTPKSLVGRCWGRSAVPVRSTRRVWECRPSGDQLGEDIMRKLLAVGWRRPLPYGRWPRLADEVTGTISNINLTRNTFDGRGQDLHGLAEQHRGCQAVRVERRRQGEGLHRGYHGQRKSRTTPCRSRRSSRASLIGKAFGLLSGAVRTPSRSDRRMPRLLQGGISG